MLIPLFALTLLSPAGDPPWDDLAECESGGNWSQGGGGYDGGLQFSDTTWDAMGGEEFAASADQASREQQIIVAERTLATQGWDAWPGCSAELGLSGGGGGEQVEVEAQSQESGGGDDDVDDGGDDEEEATPSELPVTR